MSQYTYIHNHALLLSSQSVPLTHAQVLAIKFGVQAEICIACTGVKEVDETLDFLSDQFYVNLCFAKIDGYYFPMDGRLQVAHFCNDSFL